MSSHALLVKVLRDPKQLGSLSLAQWNELIPQARQTLLLGRLYHLLQEQDLLSPLAQAPMQHCFSTHLAAQKQEETTQWEIRKLKKALKSIEVPLILLKGAAYIAADLEVAKGRILSDIDLLVPVERLTEVEKALAGYGWLSSKTDAYDQRYYRKWMHEIPPLQHIVRRGFLDVHHTLLPPTARHKLDPQKVMADAREVQPGVWVLSPCDMVIHSATHLFHEGEFDHGLRDLLDLKLLISHFAETEADYWSRLVARARELDLTRPLYYALHYVHQIFGFPVPEASMQAMQAFAPKGPLVKGMDWLFVRAFTPFHPSCALPGAAAARWMLYVRSHWLRMPPHLLVPHLLRKALRRRFERNDADVPVLPQPPEV